MDSSNLNLNPNTLSSAVESSSVDVITSAMEALEASSTPGVCSAVAEMETVVEGDVAIVSGSPGTDTSTKEQRAKRMSGAARKRFRRLMGEGVAKEQALILARLPKADIPVEKPSTEKGPVKRGRSEDESPQGHAKKAPKLASGNSGGPRPPSFREVAGSSRVGLRNSEPMSDEQMKMVHNSLTLAIRSQWSCSKGGAPKFVGFVHKTGWILVTCCDQGSKDWLVNEVTRLKPWPEANLSVIPEEELPKPATAITFIPESEASSTEDALVLLRAQNLGLNTELWKVLGEKAEQGGKVVTLALDEPSADALKANGGEAIIGFKKVLFRIKGGPNAPSKETEQQPPLPSKDPTPGPSAATPGGHNLVPQSSRGSGNNRGVAPRGKRGMLLGKGRPTVPAVGGARKGPPAARGRGTPNRVQKRAK